MGIMVFSLLRVLRPTTRALSVLGRVRRLCKLRLKVLGVDDFLQENIPVSPLNPIKALRKSQTPKTLNRETLNAEALNSCLFHHGDPCMCGPQEPNL